MNLLLVIAVAIIGAVESACYPHSCTDTMWDCWAGSNDEPCTCSHGLEARETGKSKDVWMVFNTVELFEYECCDIGTGGAHRDGTCGNYKTDDDGCTQKKCTSPANTPGGDCYAGTEWEGCTCSDGWEAVETGISGLGYDGRMYYEYTCCPHGGSTDGTCGNYAPEFDGFPMIRIVTVVVIVVLAIGGIAVYCCQRAKRRQRSASKMAEGMNPNTGIQGNYLQRASLAAPQMNGQGQHLEIVRQPMQQGVAQVVMGQNGQWIMQQPQWVQPTQSQFVYQMPEGTGTNAAPTEVVEQIPMQPLPHKIQHPLQYQYVKKDSKI